MGHCSRGVLQWMSNDQDCYTTIQNWAFESDENKQALLRSIANVFHQHATSQIGRVFLDPRTDFSGVDPDNGRTSDLFGTCNPIIERDKGQKMWVNTDSKRYLEDPIFTIASKFHECVHSAHFQLYRLHLHEDMPKGIYAPDIDYWQAFYNNETPIIMPMVSLEAYYDQMHERVAHSLTDEFTRDLKEDFKRWRQQSTICAEHSVNYYNIELVRPN